MTKTRDEVIEDAKTWTVNDLGDIASAIVALHLAGNDVVDIFEQRYAELAGNIRPDVRSTVA